MTIFAFEDFSSTLGEKIQYGTKTSFMGRAPVTLIGDKLFAFATREGKEIQLHENSVESGFKQVARITVSIKTVYRNSPN